MPKLKKKADEQIIRRPKDCSGLRSMSRVDVSFIYSKVRSLRLRRSEYCSFEASSERVTESDS